MCAQQLDRSILEGKCIVNFRAAIRSEYTRDPYERRLVHFLHWYGKDCDKFVKDAKASTIKIESKILEFVQEKKDLLKKKAITASTIGGFLKPIRLLLEMNDVTLNWRKIKRTLPPSRRFALDRAPTNDEVRSIVENADVRGKALTLLFASSGIREGAIEGAKVADFTAVKVDTELVAARLIVYPGESEQYIAFATVESWLAFQEYLKFRQMHGETVDDQSPLFRDKFDPISELRHRKIHNTHVSKPVPMTGASIRKYYNYLLHELGFREGTKRRHEFSVHGFRKFFKTTAENSGMKPINVETLMGHSTGISDSYYRPTEKDLLDDYLKAIPSLTISQEKQLRQKVEKLLVENADIDVMKKSYLDIKLELQTVKDQMMSLIRDAHSAGEVVPEKVAQRRISPIRNKPRR
jgi:integrase